MSNEARTQTKAPDQTADASSDKEHALSCGCAMTVVTEASAALHLDGGVARALQTGFDYAGTYDLLSFPSLDHLLRDRSHVDLLAADIRAAVGLHNVEKVLIASNSVSPLRIIRQLADRPEFRDRIAFKSCALSRPRRDPGQDTLVITCMDWRLQGPDGFARHLRDAFGIERFCVMATAGGGKEIGSDTTRTDMVRQQVAATAEKGLRRVIVLSHTDCGKYGGNGAFTDAAGQRKALCRDLAAASAVIASAARDILVGTGIIRVSKGRVDGVDAVTRC